MVSRCLGTHLVELKELLLLGAELIPLTKAVEAEGVGPLEDAAAVHHLRPGANLAFRLGFLHLMREGQDF